MKYLKLSLFLVLAFALQACAEEGFIKVFKCPDAKPFFNTVNNKCYTSEEAAEEVNKHLITDNDGGDDNSGGNGGDDNSGGNGGDDSSGGNGGEDNSGDNNGGQGDEGQDGDDSATP